MAAAEGESGGGDDAASLLQGGAQRRLLAAERLVGREGRGKGGLSVARGWLCFECRTTALFLE